MKRELVVYLADDHTVVRKGMARLLKTFARVKEVDEASNGLELIELISKRQPDAVILDIEMPVMGGVEAASQIANAFPGVKLLVLTMHSEEVLINHLMDLGVHGFLCKTTEPKEVERALYDIIDKEFYRNDVINRALRHSIDLPHPLLGSTLTEREVEVLLLICRELTPGEISEKLKISEKTFFSHRSNILKKTHMRTNVGLVKFAHQNGLFAV